ncbi:MAG: MarR family transcriptional regulator, partial [Actinomycetota bacterium]
MNTYLERLPLFRSHAQAKVLAEIFVYGTGPLSLTELARRTGVSVAGVHKEVTRLEAAGLIESERVGRTRRVSPNQASPYHQELRGLLLKAFGPAVLLRDALHTVPGIARAFIYGSWAASEVSPVTRPPHDVDLMVIGNAGLEAIYDSITPVEALIGRPVNVSAYTEDEWERDESGFTRSVKSGPMIE